MNTYTISFKAVAGWISPASEAVTLTVNSSVTRNYGYLQIKGDFNDDGRSDVIVQDNAGGVRVLDTSGVNLSSSSAHATRRANGEPALGSSFSDSADLTLARLGAWTIRGVGDFNSDNRQDIVAQDADGAVRVMLQDSGSFTFPESAASWIYQSALTGWTVAAVADMDGDDDPDLVLQHSGGAVAIWYIQGRAIASSAFVYAGNLPGWLVVGAADLDRDGDGDLVLQFSDGMEVFWYLQGGALSSGVIIAGTGEAEWRARGVLLSSTINSLVILVEQHTTTGVPRYRNILDEASDGVEEFDYTPAPGMRIVAVSPVPGPDAGLIFLADATPNTYTIMALPPFKEAAAQAPDVQPLWSPSIGSTFQIIGSDDRRAVGLADWDDNGDEDVMWQDAAGRIGVTYLTAGAATRSAWLTDRPVGDPGVGVGDFDLDGTADAVSQGANGRIEVHYLNYSDPDLVATTDAVVIASLSGWTVRTVGQLGAANTSADLILQHSNGMVAFWEMSNTTIQNSGFIFAGSLPGWTVCAMLDLGSTSGGAPDGQADLVLQHDNGTLAVWFLSHVGNSYVIGGSAILDLATGDDVVGAGMVSGGSQADLLLQDAAGGTITVQPFTNHTPTTATTLGLGSTIADDRVIIGSGDFDGDGNEDLYWTVGSLRIGVTLLDASGAERATSWLNATAFTGWSAIGVSDFDCDGYPDIMIRDSAGTVALWRYQGFSRVGGFFLTPALIDWMPVGTCDLDADGNMDLLLQNQSTGDLVVWYFKNLAFTGSGSYLLTNLGPDLKIRAVGDFNGDGDYDLLVLDQATDEVLIISLNHTDTTFSLPTDYVPRPL